MCINNAKIPPVSDSCSLSSDYLDRLCCMQVLPDLAERYIMYCREAEQPKKRERLPNIAGFLRFCGLYGSSIERLRHDYPENYNALCLIFEDEALNSDIPASVLSAYLKKRLGYSEPSDGLQHDASTIKLIFEHDIKSDGE